jgi:hypothetical protein
MTRFQVKSRLGKVLFFAWLITFAISWSLVVFRHHWGVPSPTTTDSSPVHFKGGEVLYFSQPVAFIIKYYLWAGFAFLFAILVAEYISRRHDQSTSDA